MSEQLVLPSLAENEEIIERHIASFFEVGYALMRIRDEEQYREAGFDGFVEYLESKPWGISRSIAYEQIDAAQVSDIVGNSLNSRQARELAPLLRKATPEVVQQVYAEVVDETAGKPTAAKIREKVQPLVHNNHPRREGSPDFNKRIDEGVIQRAKELNALRVEPDDWRVYSQTTLRRHIRVMRHSQEKLEEWIAQAEARLGHRPTK